MNRSLRTLAGLSSVVLVSLLGLAGCATECHKDATTGQTVCTAETLVQYEGTAVQKSSPWAAGETIRINVKGGNVRSGFAATAITVSGGGSAGTVAVNFRPFESNTKEKEADAKKELTENLVLDVSESNGEVVVTVSQTGTHQSSLSARVDLTLPGDFAGAIIATSESGDISIDGANGSVDAESSNADIDVSGAIHGLKVITDNGDVAVALSEAAAPVDTGSITTDRDISLTLPSESNVSLQAQAGELVTFAPNPLPDGWLSNETADTAKSLTGNNGSSGDPWQLYNADFSFSHITVTIQ